ncbi:UNVERIFIED_ORG: hypothetical protein ABIB52_000794 [Arthrobacter sp. UYCu721]
MKSLKRSAAIAVSAAALLAAMPMSGAVADGSDYASIWWNSGAVSFTASNEMLGANDMLTDSKWVRARLWHNGEIVATVTDSTVNGASEVKYLNLAPGTYYIQLCNVTMFSQEILACSNLEAVTNR